MSMASKQAAVGVGRLALVIDDSATVRRAVELALPAGWKLHSAATGAAGLACATAQTYDVVFLDYVLPDMTGVDVWNGLQAMPEPPRVVLMTGRSAERLPEFAGPTAPWASLSKPFTAQALQDLLAGLEAPTTRDDPQERLAQQLFELVRPRLAQMLASGGPTNPVRFAQRLFTPRTTAAIRHLVLRDDVQRTHSPLRFSGDFAHISSALVLRTLADGGVTGRLDVMWSEHDRLAYYLIEGDVVLSSAAPSRELALEVGLAPEQFDTQDLSARIDDEPLLLKWAAESLVPTERLRPALAQLTTDAMIRLVRAGSGQFVWHEAAEHPWWVQALGRPTSLTSLRLELVRREPERAAHLRADDVVQRAPALTQRLRGVELTTAERRLLGLVDGRRTVGELAERVGVTLDVARAALSAFTAASLVVRQARTEAPPPRAQKVIVLDDADGFGRQLVPHCVRLGVRAELVAAPALTGAIDDASVGACVVDVSAADGLEVALARHTRARSGELRLLAVVSELDHTRREQLQSDGFVVLTKPIPIDMLVRALGAVVTSREEQTIHG
jgi:CheY-like chemotaxis protein